MDGTSSDEHVAAIRRFNRLYTRVIGVLDDRMLGSPFSLAQGRVLYELAQAGSTTAAALAGPLGLDPGYLSRILRGFERQGLIARARSDADRRETLLALTDEGSAAFRLLDQGSENAVAQMLAPLSPGDRRRLVDAVGTVGALVGPPGPEPPVPYLIRPPEPGDLGWIVHRHAVLYGEAYGWDARFEALVAEIVAQFVRSGEPERQRCWVAERDGKGVGSIFAMKDSDTVARLRLLYVEPSARGLGIGRRLVDECVRFARRAGYREMVLWTHSVLASARRIYEAAGFVRDPAEETHRDFGPPATGQTWRMALDR